MRDDKVKVNIHLPIKVILRILPDNNPIKAMVRDNLTPVDFHLHLQLAAVELIG